MIHCNKPLVRFAPSMISSISKSTLPPLMVIAGLLFVPDTNSEQADENTTPPDKHPSEKLKNTENSEQKSKAGASLEIENPRIVVQENLQELPDVNVTTNEDKPGSTADSHSPPRTTAKKIPPTVTYTRGELMGNDSRRQPISSTDTFRPNLLFVQHIYGAALAGFGIYSKSATWPRLGYTPQKPGGKCHDILKRSKQGNWLEGLGSSGLLQPKR